MWWCSLSFTSSPSILKDYIACDIHHHQNCQLRRVDQMSVTDMETQSCILYGTFLFSRSPFSAFAAHALCFAVPTKPI